LTVRAWDQSSGTAGTKVSTASNGGITAFSSATDTVNVTVTAVNDASTITSLSGDSRAYSEGAGAVVIESGNALVADVDSTNFDTGTLTVSIPAGGDSAEDVLSIRHQGSGAGQIGVSGSTITYGGTTIGTFTGGSSGSHLAITLNSSATPTAVTALVRNITYQNTDTTAPTTGARTVRFVLTDGDGGTSPNYDTTVTVSAVNDVPTDLALSANSVTENAANGTVVGTVTGTDPDTGDTQSYSLTDTAGGRFAINSVTGEITVADGTLLDYESATSHSVTVRVTDAGGLTYDETFTINLTNVNEAPNLDGSSESNTVIALLGAAKPVAPAGDRADTISEVEVRPLDDLKMSIDVRPEPSFRGDAIIASAKDLPHPAHTAVVEQAAIVGGKQNLSTSSDKREGIAANLEATGNQDVASLESHNPTVQHAEEMETTSDESSRLDMPMAAGLAGMTLLHGRTGMKDKMTVMSRRIRGLPQGPTSDTKPGKSNEDEEGSVPRSSK
ncbi:MAG: cadherin domain-containing protein, partial [Nitrospira sp.]